MIKYVVIVTAFFLFSAVPVFAQETESTKPGILPSSPFYALDRLWERIGMAIIIDKTAKAERMLMHADERVAELAKLAENEQTEGFEDTLIQYQSHIDGALMLLEEAEGNDPDVDTVLMKVSEATLKHQAVLARVYEKVPQQARAGIENAMENSMKGHQRATEAVSGEKKEEVEEKNDKVRQDVEERLNTLREEGKPIPSITLPQGRPETVPLNLQDNSEPTRGQEQSNMDNRPQLPAQSKAEIPSGRSVVENL